MCTSTPFFMDLSPTPHPTTLVHLCVALCYAALYFTRGSTYIELPRWFSGEEPPWQCRRCRFDPSVGKIFWRRKQQSTLAWEVSWTVEHGKATIHGVAKELDMTSATKRQEQRVCMSIPVSQFVPLSSFHRGHVSILFVWPLFLPGKLIHLYHFFPRFHVYALIYDVCFSDWSHSVWQTLSPSTSLPMTLFCPFQWLCNSALIFNVMLLESYWRQKVIQHFFGLNYFGNYFPKVYFLCSIVFSIRQSAAAAAESLQSCPAQVTRLPRLWDSPGKSTRVGCHFLLHESGKWKMKVKSETHTNWTLRFLIFSGRRS